MMEDERRKVHMMPDIAEIDAALQTDYTVSKRILVAGADSYIGRSFACFMKRWPNTYKVDMLSMKGGSWKTFDFSGYDAVLYAEETECRQEAGGKLPVFKKADAYKTVHAADRAMAAGAGMFIYLSSLYVYGNRSGVITGATPANPSDEYGKLKLDVEKELWKRSNKRFRVAILRMPVVYGYECRGRYEKLAGFVSMSGFFPKYGYRYSMIHIVNTSSVIRGIIHYGKAGLYFPQDVNYTSAFEIAERIAEFHGKRLRSTTVFNPLIRLLARKVRPVHEIFEGLVCDQGLNVPEEWIEVKGSRECIRLSESGW